MAAMAVALIVIFISGELGWRTINALLDAAPKGMTEKIMANVGKMKGIHDCHAVRIRPSGAIWFVDLHVTMDGDATLNEVHEMTEKIERKCTAIAAIRCDRARRAAGIGGNGNLIF